MNVKKCFVIITGLLFAILTGTVDLCSGMDGYTGSETCLECHDDTYSNMRNTPHMITADPRKPGAVNRCESCHGPGSSHAESGDIEDILTFGNHSLQNQDMKNEICLKCHDNGRQAQWNGSVHDTRGISCADCHKIHDGNEIISAGRKEIIPETLCFKCHPRIKSQLMRQSRHPLREGKMKCADCHNPHGSISDKLIDAQQTNLKCFECHEEKRGPFLWEHPPASEDCLTCHTAHGSNHSPLLTAKAPYLCQRCHSDQVHSGDLYAKNPAEQNRSVYQAGPSAFFYRACLNCHSTVHGSNHPSGKALLR